MNVKKGRIEKCMISGSSFSESEALELSKKLVGKRHFYEDVIDVLHTDYEEFIYAFF